MKRVGHECHERTRMDLFAAKRRKKSQKESASILVHYRASLWPLRPRFTGSPTRCSHFAVSSFGDSDSFRISRFGFRIWSRYPISPPFHHSNSPALHPQTIVAETGDDGRAEAHFQTPANFLRQFQVRVPAEDDDLFHIVFSLA